MANRKQNEQTIRRLCEDVPVTVFIAEPLTGRLIVDAQPGEPPDETAQRQGFVDLITKWKP